MTEKGIYVSTIFSKINYNLPIFIDYILNVVADEIKWQNNIKCSCHKEIWYHDKKKKNHH